MRFAKLTVLFVLFFVCSAVWAAVPKLINFQGILKDALGNPVADGSYSVGFKIYDAASGGNILWAETLSVTTTGGLFNVLLGSSNPVPDSAFDDTSRWLGITVGSDPEMTPRQRLVSVPYSYKPVAQIGGVPQDMQEFSTPGTDNFTVPVGVTRLLVEVWGAGGGGGGSGADGQGCGGGGGGGGSGGYSRTIITVTPGEIFVVKIGMEGNGGAVNTGGGNGGNSSFETNASVVLVISSGGGGGVSGVAGVLGAGGAGGTGGLGDVNALIKRIGNAGITGARGNSGTFNCFVGLGGNGGLEIGGTMEPPETFGGKGGGTGAVGSSGMSGGDGYVLIQW